MRHLAYLALAGALTACGFTELSTKVPPIALETGRSDGFRADETLLLERSLLSQMHRIKRTGTDPDSGRSYAYGPYIGAYLPPETVAGATGPAEAPAMQAQCMASPSGDGPCEIRLGETLVLGLDSDGQVARICTNGGYDLRMWVDQGAPMTTRAGCLDRTQSAQFSKQLDAGRSLFMQGGSATRILPIYGALPLARDLFEFSQSAPASLFEPSG